MSYTVNKTDGTIVATVEDGTLNTDTSLTLIGRNYQGYGDIVAENFITLLENSSNSSAPTKPLTGELWFDSGSKALKIYDGNYFEYINSVRPSATQPTQSLRTGVLWYDTSTSLLKLYTGSSFVTVGPTTILDEDNMASNDNTAVPSQQSVKAYVDAQIVASNTLPIRADDSNQIDVLFTEGVYFRGGTNVTTSVDTDSTAGVPGEKRVTISLDITNFIADNISSSDSTTVTINDNLTVNGNTSTDRIVVNEIISDDSTSVSVLDNLNVEGIIQASTGLKMSNGTFTLGTGAGVTTILDEDNLSSDSATALATQQSIKAYVDAGLAGLSQSSISQGDSNVTVTDAGSGSVTIDADGGTKITVNTTNTTIAQPLLVTSDSGITVGADSDVTLTQSGAHFTLKNTTEDGNIYLNVNDGGSDTTAITIDGATASVSITNNLTVTGNLQVDGTTTTINTTNTTIEDALLVLNTGMSAANTYDGGLIVERGSATNVGVIWDESLDEFSFINTTENGSTAGNVTIASYANIHFLEATGQASSALYADLAERYEADMSLDIGDCVKLGGSKEITKTTHEYDTDVFGVIAENPAFKMNSGAGEDSTHPYVTLTGRTVCKVQGPIAKGDRICASDVPGVAKKCDINNEKFHILSIIGRSLGEHSTTDVAMIEVVLGRN